MAFFYQRYLESVSQPAAKPRDPSRLSKALNRTLYPTSIYQQHPLKGSLHNSPPEPSLTSEIHLNLTNYPNPLLSLPTELWLLVAQQDLSPATLHSWRLTCKRAYSILPAPPLDQAETDAFAFMLRRDLYSGYAAQAVLGPSTSNERSAFSSDRDSASEVPRRWRAGRATRHLAPLD